MRDRTTLETIACVAIPVVILIGLAGQSSFAAKYRADRRLEAEPNPIIQYAETRHQPGNVYEIRP